MILYGTAGTIAVNGVELVSSVLNLDEIPFSYPQQGHIATFNATLFGKWKFARRCHPANLMAKKIRGYARRCGAKVAR